MQFTLYSLIDWKVGDWPGLLIDDAVEVLLAGGAEDGEDVVELIQVVLAGEDGAVGHHLGQDAADGPHVYGLGVALTQYEAKGY